MCKRWIHREIDVTKEAAEGDREVALELEEYPGMVGFARRRVWGVRIGRLYAFFLHDLHSGTHANCHCR